MTTLPGPADQCPAIAPLLAAFASGTKRSRLRQMVIVCSRGHTLAEVFPAAQGPHVVWPEWQTTEYMSPLPSFGRLLIDGRRVVLAAPLAEDGYDLTGACRCTEKARIAQSDIAAWLEAGRTRVVHVHR